MAGATDHQVDPAGNELDHPYRPKPPVPPKPIEPRAKMPYKKPTAIYRGIFMLSSIRKGLSSFFVVLLMGLLILSFAIWGIGDAFRMNTGNGIAVVGDRTITPAAYARELQNELQRWQQQTGLTISIEEAKQLGVPQQVLQRMLNRETFDLAAEKLGLSASDDLVYNLIHNAPEFKNSFGEFDKALYEGILRSSGLSVSEFEKAARTDITRNQLLRALMGAVPVPTDLAKQLFAYHGEERVIGVLRFPASVVSGIGTPTDEQVKAYYDANKNQFMAPEYRELSVITMDPSNFAGAVSYTDEDLKNYYEDHHAEFSKPELRAVSQIVVGDKAEADKVRDALAAGQDFDAVAKEIAGLDADDTALGNKSRAELAAELNEAAADAVFDLKAGSVTSPVESAFGWHILKVTAITEGDARSFDDVRATIETAVKQEKALDHLYNQVNRIEDEISGGASIDDIAKSIELPVTKIAAIDGAGNGPDGQPVATLPTSISGFLEKAFSTEAGDDLSVQDAGGSHYYVLSVESITPEAVRPFDSVKAEVAAKWQAAQRDSAAKTAAEAAQKALADGTAFAAVTGASGGQDNIRVGRVPLPNTMNVTPEIREAAFAQAPGKAAVIPAADKDGYLVVTVTSSTPGNAATSGEPFAEFEKSLALRYSNDVLAVYQQYLQRQYGSKYNDTLFNETLAQLPAAR